MKEVIFFLEPGSAAADWRHRAACRDIPDPDIFFPIGTSGAALEQIEAAKRICQVCSVRRHCLRWALSTNQDTGIWGGLSEDERRDLARTRGEPALV
ncbi:MAG: WhiB family transcriptional regulator [Candidatus Methylomirabilales bacterium]